MESHELFALAFIAVAVFGPLIAVFLEYGLEPIVNKMVKYVDARNKREKDKDI